jgi:hypothetical protein
VGVLARDDRLVERCKKAGMSNLILRIRELERLSVGDGVPLMRRSVADFLRLTVAHNLLHPVLSVTEGGALRAVWTGDGWQVGLHFLGGGEVNFVIANSVGGISDQNYGKSALRPIRNYLLAIGIWKCMGKLSA